mmetsp:Transcript_33034/g.97885  ORF Transcript_33034/g.97885 Transcript_33034/m.97885 type:complete len:129 (-) Transcript_33034:166-552(-)
MLAGAQYNALNTLHSTLCWLVQNYQCADWRAVCVSPRVAREDGRLERRGCRSTPRRMDAAEAARLRASLRQKRPPSALLSPAFYDNFRFIIAAELYLAVSLIGVSLLRVLFSYYRRVVAWGRYVFSYH